MNSPNPKVVIKDGSNSTARKPVQRPALTIHEVQTAFKDSPQFPPVLSLAQAASLAHLASGTIKRLVSEGFFGNSVRRGKPVAFWRDRFVAEVMELDKARQRRKHSRAQKKP